MRNVRFFRNVLIAGIACFVIGQRLIHAAPPGLTDNSDTRWRLSSYPEENQKTLDYFPESLSAEGNPETSPEFSPPDPDVESLTRTKRNSNKKDKAKSSGKKPTLEYQGIDPCQPCPGAVGGQVVNKIVPVKRESEADLLDRLQGMVGPVKKDTQDVLDGYTDLGRQQTEAYEAIAKKISFPKPTRPPGKKSARKLFGSKKRLAKHMQKHYKSLSAAYFHMHFIQKDEKRFEENFTRLDTLVYENKVVLESMNTLLCQLYASDWTPDKCASPSIKSIQKLYDEGLDNNAEIWDRDLVVLRYNYEALDNLNTTLNSLLTASKSSNKKKKGNKRGRRRGDKKGRGKGNKRDRKNRNKKNKAEN